MLKTLFAISAVASEYAELESQLLSLDISHEDVAFHDTIRQIANGLRGYPDEDFKPSEKCIECVKGAAKCAVEDSLKRVDKFCEKAGAAAQFCAFYKKAPLIAKGLLIYYIQPCTIGISYCFGKAVCNKHDLPNIFRESGNISFSNEFELPELHQDTLTEFQSSVQITNLDATDFADENDFKECVRKAGLKTWCQTVQAVKEWCEKDGDKHHAKKFCDWGKAHPKEAAGFILGATQPFTYAAGFCAGKKKDADVKELNEAREAMKEIFM